MHHADKHHVPVRARPVLPIAVARDPLLLAAGSDIPHHHPRFWCSTRSPRTCMRRSDTACDTAHCIVPPAGAIETPSAALQKVVVALLFLWFASACMLPAIRVASGEEPNPITSV